MKLDKIREALGLLNSMVLSGEKHSEKSIQVFHDAMEELKAVEHPRILQPGETITIRV